MTTRLRSLEHRSRDRAAVAGQTGERGSALVIALLVSVILMLLGVAFLLMGETENRIAQNEKRSAQAFYVAEAGARAVKRWFDRPHTALHLPASAVVDRTQRMILDETDPEDPAKATAADGVVGSHPYYKQTVDLDSDGNDDLFDRPFRGGALHSLMGMPDGPDIRIDASNPSALSFLTDLTRSLVGDFPGEPGGVFSRIERIDIYAPPYVDVGGTWSRYGLATIKVVARLYGMNEQVLATREVELVLGEAPYRGPYGPLHSCGDLTFTNNSSLSVHWGVISAVGESKLTLGPAPTYLPDRIADSLPREEPSIPGVDPLWSGIAPALFNTWVDTIDGRAIDDPWFRVMSGEEIRGAPSGVRPWPPDDSPPDDDWEDHSGLAQYVPLVVCPEYDYEIWKQVATSGESDVRYFVWSGSGDTFLENGTGSPASFEALTDDQEGVFFFDTRDARRPTDFDGDGLYDNLTPDIIVNAAGWHFRGLIYLNAGRFGLDTTPSPSATAAMRAPGEPCQDVDQDGEYDGGESWINLDYGASLGAPCTADKTDTFGGSVMRNDRGPPIDEPVSFEGILFSNGSFEATGEGTIYGSVIAWEGVVQAIDDGSLPTPDLYWNASILDDFPPPGWDLPRTVVTGWRARR